MPRKYEKVQELLPTVKALVEEGYTQQQIAEQLGLGGGRGCKRTLESGTKERTAGCTKTARP